jgi:hypothetical protein
MACKASGKVELDIVQRCAGGGVLTVELSRARVGRERHHGTVWHGWRACRQAADKLGVAASATRRRSHLSGALACGCVRLPTKARAARVRGVIRGHGRR